MNFEAIKKIYPDSRLNKQLTHDDDYLLISVTEGFVQIPKGSLTEKETALLTALAPLPAPEIGRNHPWYAILFEGAAPDAVQPIRVIQLRLKQPKDFLEKEWLEQLDSIFPFLLDTFFVSRQECLLVERKSDSLLSNEELFGMFQALDSDFNTYTQIFIGTFYPENSDYSENFLAERELFQKQLTARSSQQNFHLTQSAVDQAVVKNFRQQPFLKTLYQNWLAEEELTSTIQALWQHQGNVSSTAKELFVHRNTLLYRLDKFQEQTKLDLKNMDDLLFCQLLISAFQ